MKLSTYKLQPFNISDGVIDWVEQGSYGSVKVREFKIWSGKMLLPKKSDEVG